jgi:Na+-transporting NADH:ubiquinone oxidoreductase subunit A
MIKIRRGMDLPISGGPRQEIGDSNSARSVAILGRDYVGMKPTMEVSPGDRVKLGQLLFTDKKTPGVRFTAPGAGVVAAINRGEKRTLKSVVIDLDGDEEVEFRQFADHELRSIATEQIVEALVASGIWTAFRTRPYSRVPDPRLRPRSLFVNVMDTNPLAADPTVVLADAGADFLRGLVALARLPENRLFVCKGPGLLPAIDAEALPANVMVEEFDGPHPAGLSGTHMHFLDPAGPSRQSWSINYQDVVAIGRQLASGRLSVQRIVSLAGPQVQEPRLVASRLGANLQELTLGELFPGENRVISGSVLSGNRADGAEAYLGRYHLQVSVLREGREREFLGYLSAGVNRHSVMGVYLSGLFRGKSIAFTTTTYGSERAMVPVGNYEKVMPLDILPTQLLRALIVGDIEMAQNLGALELDEEDLALCSYVCAGKYDYGPILRANLTTIEKES